jgi:hypothetical protein
MNYPVTVVIPTIDSRYKFLTEVCLPSVKAAKPAEIIVVGGDDLNGNEKRNVGRRGSSQPFILNVDDDSTLQSNCIHEMMVALLKDENATFAYSDYRVEVAPGVEYKNPAGDMYPGVWNPDRLRRGNYIDVTSMIRKDDLLGIFDARIKRFQDWDLWLTMLDMRCRGTYVHQNLFTKHVIDQGVTLRIPDDEAMAAIKEKHRL